VDVISRTTNLSKKNLKLYSSWNGESMYLDGYGDLYRAHHMSGHVR